MTNRWLRLARHRLVDERDAERALGAGALERIEKRVAASELHHSGEIRVCVEAGLPFSYIWRGASARERALAMFGKLRVWDTDHNNGVLIYLLLAERRIEIVADRGLVRHVDAELWTKITTQMAASFRAGTLEAGIDQAIGTVDGLLREHYPLEAGTLNPNELPDAPTLF